MSKQASHHSLIDPFFLLFSLVACPPAGRRENNPYLTLRLTPWLSNLLCSMQFPEEKQSPFPGSARALGSLMFPKTDNLEYNSTSYTASQRSARISL